MNGWIIIRTRGNRADLLRLALFSVAAQVTQVRALIIVHEGEGPTRSVNALCAEISGLCYEVISAPDLTRGRSYPLNVALDHIRNVSADTFTWAAFLDDDDVLFPFFATEVENAYKMRRADVFYFPSLAVRPGEPSIHAYGQQDIAQLLIENFIPINAFAFNVGKVNVKGIRFREDLSFTEDWAFLLNLLKNSFRFEYVGRYSSQFLIHSDGNLREKVDAIGWKSASLAIRSEINKSTFPIPGDQLVRMHSERDSSVPSMHKSENGSALFSPPARFPRLKRFVLRLARFL